MASTLAQTIKWVLVNPDDANQSTDGLPDVVRTLTLTGSKAYRIDLNIGTSEETVTIANVAPDVGTNPHVCILNRDTTNFLQIGFATGDYNLRASALGHLSGQIDAETALFLLADTAAIDIELYLVTA